MPFGSSVFSCDWLAKHQPWHIPLFFAEVKFFPSKRTQWHPGFKVSNACSLSVWECERERKRKWPRKENIWLDPPGKDSVLSSTSSFWRLIGGPWLYEAECWHMMVGSTDTQQQRLRAICQLLIQCQTLQPSMNYGLGSHWSDSLDIGCGYKLATAWLFQVANCRMRITIFIILATIRNKYRNLQANHLLQKTAGCPNPNAPNDNSPTLTSKQLALFLFLKI